MMTTTTMTIIDDDDDMPVHIDNCDNDSEDDDEDNDDDDDDYDDNDDDSVGCVVLSYYYGCVGRLVHTGRKPYQCAKCSHQFNDARNLKRHMRIHENIFPYICPVCKRGWVSSLLL
jgi:uncharacterized Zn-finger protein